MNETILLIQYILAYFLPPQNGFEVEMIKAAAALIFWGFGLIISVSAVFFGAYLLHKKGLIKAL
ncbi:hypothetical protein [Vibrio barjaei]|uniref:hypothetical protein n=1 Tax=Vibrio barjaei TaxID=1676683 RepID=UPI002283ECB9|nr:hypothetical protein [Vibrio barjaei]MCY9874076.1 hypothetical protein [Vibrio barjaei]